MPTLQENWCGRQRT